MCSMRLVSLSIYGFIAEVCLALWSLLTLIWLVMSAGQDFYTQVTRLFSAGTYTESDKALHGKRVLVKESAYDRRRGCLYWKRGHLYWKHGHLYWKWALILKTIRPCTLKESGYDRLISSGNILRHIKTCQQDLSNIFCFIKISLIV